MVWVIMIFVFIVKAEVYFSQKIEDIKFINVYMHLKFCITCVRIYIYIIKLFLWYVPG